MGRYVSRDLSRGLMLQITSTKPSFFCSESRSRGGGCSDENGINTKKSMRVKIQERLVMHLAGNRSPWLAKPSPTRDIGKKQFNFNEEKKAPRAASHTHKDRLPERIWVCNQTTCTKAETGSVHREKRILAAWRLDIFPIYPKP